MKTERSTAPYWGRGLRREEAANYLGFSVSHFDNQVKLGIMPKPKKFGAVAVWDRYQLDLAFERHGKEEGEEANPWD